MADVVIVIGAGWIGQAIARRVGIGKHVLMDGGITAFWFGDRATP